MLIHIFQFIPLSLLLYSSANNHWIDLNSILPEFSSLSVIAVLTFFSSLKIDGRRTGNVFLILFTVLFLFLINKLYLNPSLGIILSSIYIVTFFKVRSSHLTETELSSYSVLWPYFISATLFLFLKLEMYLSLPMTLLAANLSFASVVYIVGFKANIINTSRVIASLVIALSSLILLFLDELKVLLVVTDIWFVTISILSLIIIIRFKETKNSNIIAQLFKFPEATLFSYFIFFSVVGALFLLLPVSQSGQNPISTLDALFTALSAVCVTGLIVLDTPVDFSVFGQSVILVLIQLGGFGIVAMSSWVLIGFQSTRMSLEQEQVLKAMSGHKPSLAGVQSTLRRIFFYFITFECVGTLILFLSFLNYDLNYKQAFWRALFTSISAFCNAGFALQSDSLIPYQSDVLILITVSVLIIAGGFAPLMAINLPQKIWHKKLSLQEKLVLSVSSGLLAFGFFLFMIVEWNYSLSELRLLDKILNSWFQSVTTRTAGFNSVDFTQLAPLTPYFLMFLMFIGGNPGGTAGGIKTITFAVILAGALAGVRGENHIRIFNRHISSSNIYRTLAIFFVMFLTTSIAFFMLSVTHYIPVTSLLFEVVSALGTVGLSIGATSGLDEVGKIIVAFCMLLGRVGPLAFILLLFRTRSRNNWKVPKEDIYIS